MAWSFGNHSAIDPGTDYEDICFSHPNKDPELLPSYLPQFNNQVKS